MHQENPQTTSPDETLAKRTSQLLSIIEGPAFALSAEGFLIETNKKALGLLLQGNSVEDFDFADHIDAASWSSILKFLNNPENTNSLTIDNVQYTCPSQHVLHCSLRCVPNQDFFIIQASIKTTLSNQINFEFGEKGFTDAMLEAIPAPVFYKDINHIYVACNQEFLDFNGYTRNQIIGKNVFEIAPHEVAKVYRKADDDLFAVGGKQVYETQTENSYGERKDVVFHKSVLTDSSGEPIGLIGIILDITARKQAERKLQESKNMFSAIVENSPSHIFVKNIEGEYVAASENLTRIFGWPKDYMLEKTDFELFSKETALEFTKQDKEIILERRAISEQTIIEKKDFLTTFLTVKFPLFDSHGNPNGIAGIATDISSLVAAEETLKKSKSDLEEQIRERTKELSEEVEIRKNAEGALRDMLAASPVAVGISEIKTGQMSFVNDSLSDLLGKPKEKLLSTSTLTFWKNPEDRKRLLKEFQKYGKTKLCEVEIVRSDGQDIWVLLSWTSLTIDGEDKIVFWISDISQIKAAEKLLRDSHEVLEEHVALRTQELEAEITERRKVEETLRKSEALFEASANSTSDWFWGMDENFKYDSFSDRFEEITGLDAAKLLGKTRWDVSKGSLSEKEWGAHRELLNKHNPFRDFRFPIFKQDGSIFHASISGMPIFDETGAFKGYRGAGRDISQELHASEQKKHVEEQLHQAQKMEAIGQLTGGIAHDFNNILAVIIGNIELVKDQLTDDSFLGKYMDSVESAAMRGAKLTQRLLAYSRKQELRPTSIQLNNLIDGILNLVDRLIGEAVSIHCTYGDEIPPVIADSNQLENALMNLCINARDSMPNGGDLYIKTGILIVNAENEDKHPELKLGKYSWLSVTDTGCGMKPEILTHVFEPFFTTKEVGKGTGLGLSMVYGFAHQSNGTVTLESTPNEGTTATIILPSSPTEA